ncbi:response regulator transcription factor [Halanaerobium hydrogeniformans]|uniref:Stage 0 sporulation protein A homolog n=1 Tax=Halanaerobium hydrogeniformans TaxID=656519 RepID=E4RPX1_HALHG|nr:response regulator [Halanaerobium hydrogeniformans]ADQ14338.1 two component transcriptional regulator, AraC family [Halanaerobium hydrogeniformans]
MYKILIAEDEKIERKAIKFYLNEFYSKEFEIVAEIANGKEAVKKALENDVDLVLMDIKMPKMDGLEAAKKIKEKNEEIEIIILTAHSEFDYAKKSIEIGVIDYLVKPYLEDDFCRVIDKSLAKIKEKEINKSREKNLVNKVKETLPFLEKEIILEVVYNTKASLVNFEEHKKLLGIEAAEHQFLLLSAKPREKLSDTFFYKAKKIVKKHFKGTISYNGLNDIIFLIIADNLEDDAEQKKMDIIINELKKNYNEKYNSRLYLKKSRVIKDIKNLNQIYNKTRSHLFESELQIDSYPYQREKNIFAKIIDKDQNAAETEFAEVYQYLIEEENCDISSIRSYLRRFVIFLNRRIMEYYNREEPLFNLEKTENEIAAISDLENLKLYVENLINKIILNISHTHKEQKVEVIEKVKQYIQDNYCHDITLEMVAEHIAFSKYYLSKLFKEVEGINYKDYLIKVRMEKAKELLKDGVKIKVVAQKVGYSNRNYFSRSFKKYTGISPGKYK